MARSVNLRGFKEYEKKMKTAGAKLSKLADLEASASAQIIANAARNRAPVNDGTLRASIHAQGANGKYKVTASAEYAAFVEFGTKSKAKVPADLQAYAQQFKGPSGNGKQAKEMIYEWCRKKGIEKERWWGIFISIMVHGIRPHPFLFPSVDEEQPKFYERVKNLLNHL